MRAQYGESFTMNKTAVTRLSLALAIGGAHAAALGQTDPEAAADPIYEEVLVTGGADAIRTLAGSANLLDETQILKFDATDINALLTQVPGVYLRIEDGYGLRPNIGLRGATSERSQKITLMEDGILIAPAPYSAPAAYYLPNINRMESVEVFKGPSAIQHGPHTVGGALNLVTPAAPQDSEGHLEAMAGSDGYQKYRATYGDAQGQWSYLLDALHYRADGFKELDSGGDTGFERSDINAKIQWYSEGGAFDQRIQLKLGYAEEDSDETYLGLSDADFEAQPGRRYVASEFDRYESEHWQAHVIHLADFRNDWQLTSKAYYNRFDRAWFKFDGFIDPAATAAPVVLANPEQYAREMALLRGEVNSDGSDAETLDVADFDREYGSMGADFRLSHQRQWGHADHELEVGLRYHYDYVDREQTPYGYQVIDGALVFDGRAREQLVFNEWQTDALAVFFSDSIEYGAWKIDLGLRYEYIEGEAKDLLAETRNDTEQDIWLPGVGVFYQLTPEWGLLAGVNKGFSPASPGASDEVDPEESINYEYGVRYTGQNLNADLIGFFSDYDNLLGRCRVSDPGCTVGEEFNGGEVEVAGAEFTANYTAELTPGLWMPVSMVYTYTESAFQSSFTSGFSQWNPGYFDGVQRAVRRGDELPYMPEHQGRLQFGLTGIDWSVDVAVKYVSEMREVPGFGDYVDGESTEAYTLVDLAASYNFTEQLSVKLVAENLGDEMETVSRRPFGARPNLPLTVRAGVSYEF